MVTRRLIWSEQAKADTKKIFDYWNHRNKSKRYSNKLGKVFLGTANRILKTPHLGIEVNNKNLFYLVMEKKFLMIYKITPETIDIISVWDGRRNPEDYEKLINKPL